MINQRRLSGIHRRMKKITNEGGADEESDAPPSVTSEHRRISSRTIDPAAPRAAPIQNLPFPLKNPERYRSYSLNVIGRFHY